MAIEGAQKGSLLVVGDDNLLEFKAVVGFNLDKLKKVKFRVEDTFLWNENNGNMKEACIINNSRKYNEERIDTEIDKLLKKHGALDIKSTLSSPIIVNGEFYGMLNIDSTAEDAFNEEDIKLMEYFSNQIGIAIRNHQLIEKIVNLSRYDSLTNIYSRHYRKLMIPLGMLSVIW